MLEIIDLTQKLDKDEYERQTDLYQTQVRLLGYHLYHQQRPCVIVSEGWDEARKYWESSEGFLWGPIDTEGYDPKLDDWPVNKVDLDNILADANVDLGNQGVIDQLETTVKGFHTIEYLLSHDGTGNEDTSGCGAAAPGTQACYDNILAALADPRRIEYLVGISINLETAAHPPLAAFRLAGVALVCRRGDRFGPSLRVGTVTLSTLIAFNGAAPDAREPL